MLVSTYSIQWTKTKSELDGRLLIMLFHHRQVEGGSTVWLEEKACALQSSGRVELMFRPFLRWLDRNLEDMFTKGLMQVT